MNSVNACRVVVFAVAAACSQAMAQELVFNGGFETGNFSGWNVPPNVPNESLFRVATNANPHSGTHWAGMASRQIWYLSQVVPTTAGTEYELSFWLRRPTDIPDFFRVRWEGQTVYERFPLQLPDGVNWHRLSIPLHANISGSFLEFGQMAYPGEWQIDDISVMTPAPSAAALLLMGGAIALRRRRR